MNRIKYTVNIVLVFILFGTNAIFAQLTLSPSNLEFKDSWHRLQNINLINTGTQPVTIDSIYYKSNVNYSTNFYLTRFNKYGDFPFTLKPGDSVVMDCILSGYFSITSKDTVDTMLIATSTKAEAIGIKIDFLSGYNYYGIVYGQVTDGQDPLDSASVMFFYNGDFLFKTTVTAANGEYSAELPPGEYTIAVERQGYSFTFYDQQPDPYCAKRITVAQEISTQINFKMTKQSQSGYSLSGHILDQTSGALLKRAVIIVRRGIHTPSKKNKNASVDEYSGVMNSDGTFKIQNIAGGTYIVQSTSSYYVPAYYTSINKPGTFWQDASPMVINQDIQNTTISMLRDSSTGGGTITGKVLSDDSSFDFCGITIYAYSLLNNDTTIYSYTFADGLGNFEISGLPFGSYKLIAQKIGYANALFSQSLVLNGDIRAITGIKLYFDEAGDGTAPINAQLYQNYPNPFNPTTTISFVIVNNLNVTLRITNVLGQQVAILHQGFLPAGDYSFRFNGSNFASGVYFVSLISNDVMQTKKMVLLK
jgi:Secretion system C-terminal sorting domain/Carboxypeptidase regulatory-like domain